MRVCVHAHAKMFNVICPDKVQMKLIALFWPGSFFDSLQNIGPLRVVSESSVFLLFMKRPQKQQSLYSNIRQSLCNL